MDEGASCECVAAFVYGGPVADAIHRLKYGRRAEFAAALGDALTLVAGRFAGKVDRVIPVPLHPSRLRTRGFNQSALLARAVARRLSVPLDTRTLSRVRPTREQAGLGRSERRANVEDAFRSRPPPRPGQRVLLIDDVETTGSTFAAAARALELAGFGTVSTLALARAGSDSF